MSLMIHGIMTGHDMMPWEKMNCTVRAPGARGETAVEKTIAHETVVFVEGSRGAENSPLYSDRHSCVSCSVATWLPPLFYWQPLRTGFPRAVLFLGVAFTQ